MTIKKYSIQNLVKRLVAALQPSSESERVAEREAWWLLEKLTGKSETSLRVYESVELSDAQQQTLDEWLKQRVDEKKPLQYILGLVPFCNLQILVAPPILIPRPETEEIVCWIVDTLTAAGRTDIDILDLCTGSGCIGLALASLLPNSRVVGIDINPQAIELAEKNKAHSALSNIEFVLSDLYTALNPAQKFDLIVSNPPYLSSLCYQEVTDEIRLWEDKRALVADDEGMALYEKIIVEAPRFLKPAQHDSQSYLPQVIFEIGKPQVSIESMLLSGEFRDIRVMNDMQGMRRWVSACI